MGQALELAVRLTSIDCGCCGGTYAINERFRKHAEENGSSWTCPYCKAGWGFQGNGEVDRLRKEAQQLRDRTTAALSRANEAEASKAMLERRLKRVGKGVCPCCNRTFRDLARHMASKHPKGAA